MTPARITITLVIAALLAVAGFFLFQRLGVVPVVTEAPPQPAAPPGPPPAPLEKPRLWKVANDMPCLDAQPMRFDAAPAVPYGAWKPIGVMLTNNCDAAQVIADIKYSATALEYVSSRLPEPVALLGTSGDVAPAKIVTLSRGGEGCETAEPSAERCRLLPIPPKQRAFIALPDQSWFYIKLADEKKITGFSGLPQDPNKPVPVPKMPEMGFKLKGVGDR